MLPPLRPPSLPHHTAHPCPALLQPHSPILLPSLFFSHATKHSRVETLYFYHRFQHSRLGPPLMIEDVCTSTSPLAILASRTACRPNLACHWFLLGLHLALAPVLSQSSDITVRCSGGLPLHPPGSHTLCKGDETECASSRQSGSCIAALSPARVCGERSARTRRATRSCRCMKKGRAAAIAGAGSNTLVGLPCIHSCCARQMVESTWHASLKNVSGRRHPAAAQLAAGSQRHSLPS